MASQHLCSVIDLPKCQMSSGPPGPMFLGAILKCNDFGFNVAEVLQGGHGTGKTGKTGNLTLTFSRQGKHREFCCDTGKIVETQGKYFDCILLCECYILMYFWQSWFQIMGVCR